MTVKENTEEFSTTQLNDLIEALHRNWLMSRETQWIGPVNHKETSKPPSHKYNSHTSHWNTNIEGRTNTECNKKVKLTSAGFVVYVGSLCLCHCHFRSSGDMKKGFGLLWFYLCLSWSGGDFDKQNQSLCLAVLEKETLFRVSHSRHDTHQRILLLVLLSRFV